MRLLVREDETGTVWAVYSDFGWIARRHAITDRGAAFDIANVIASITSTVIAT